MIIQDVSREHNINGRCAGVIGAGPFTRYVEVERDDIVVCASDVDGDGNPVEIHRAQDELRGLDFATRTIQCRRSGIDGKLILVLGGLTPGSGASRRLTLKLDLVVAPAT
ncbi:MAG TPA: hypothetical protein VIL85_01640 [Thermomicrobiales bacterium]|jgi:hypothetical protein